MITCPKIGMWYSGLNRSFMAKMCELMGIPLLDHVIVGGDNLQYFSFKEKKLMDTPKVFLETNYKSLDLSSGLVAEQGKAR